MPFRLSLPCLPAALLCGAVACLDAGPVAAAAGPVSEVRLGVLWPDLGPPDARLPGADVNAEVLFVSPFSGWTANLPGWLRWAAQPQVQVGGSVNTAVSSQQAYAGLSWTVPLASGVLHADDGLTLGFSLGPALLGGGGTPHGLDTSGAHLRLGAEVGYQVTPRVGLYVLFDHISSSATNHDSESLNDLGVRVGLRF
jgi:hypothetical protein